MHFVNIDPSGVARLTFGTAYVLNVNRDAAGGRKSTKCTPRRPTQRS